ncbi:MAG TPA: HNH endonuclease family protein [Patescibacteria group bacterium]|nr:HNH endonuclease family protein [Patescibacteria group bacterium]
MRHIIGTPATRPRAASRLLVLLVAALLVATSGAPATAATPVSGTALQLLARLSTAPEHPTGYDRALFVHWIDADRDGCDTRREVLISESRTTPRVGARCSVSGSWRSAYDGVTTTQASSFDVDHVVALKEASDSGAWAWAPARRRAFANDLGDSRSLRAVSASSNRSKSDRDPAQWLPPLASFHCTYATDWVAVKVRWRLSVDSREHAALRRILTACPARTVTVAVLPAPPVPSPVPSPTPSPVPSPTLASGGACDPNYAGHCVPIVGHDLNCSDIGARVTVVGVDIHRFDVDGDGIGCDSYP